MNERQVTLSVRLTILHWSQDKSWTQGSNYILGSHIPRSRQSSYLFHPLPIRPLWMGRWGEGSDLGWRILGADSAAIRGVLRRCYTSPIPAQSWFMLFDCKASYQSGVDANTISLIRYTDFSISFIYVLILQQCGIWRVDWNAGSVCVCVCVFVCSDLQASAATRRTSGTRAEE